jgi:hypothetical protein
MVNLAILLFEDIRFFRTASSLKEEILEDTSDKKWICKSVLYPIYFQDMYRYDIRNTEMKKSYSMKLFCRINLV